MDIIKTIEDDEEIENLSEDSDVEIEVRKMKKTREFDKNFNVSFVPSSINQQSRRHRKRNCLKTASSLCRQLKNTTKTHGMI